MFRWLQLNKTKKLLASGVPRRIRIHSVRAEPASQPRPDFHRVAFEFLDPPGPWSMQFYEAELLSPELLAQLQPGLIARFYETEDGARTRLMALEDGTPVWPK